jgi:hypothetical protein
MKKTTNYEARLQCFGRIRRFGCFGRFGRVGSFGRFRCFGRFRRFGHLHKRVHLALVQIHVVNHLVTSYLKVVLDALDALEVLDAFDVLDALDVLDICKKSYKRVHLGLVQIHGINHLVTIYLEVVYRFHGPRTPHYCIIPGERMRGVRNGGKIWEWWE